MSLRPSSRRRSRARFGADARLALAGMVLLVGGAAPGRADFAGIQARGVLRVLVSADENPAWFSVGPAPVPGFEREVLEGFCRLRKLRLEVVPVRRWDQAIPDLQDGKGDVIAGINDTAARRRLIDFTAELLPAAHLVVTRKPHPLIRRPEDLRRERVAIVPETTWAEAVAAAGVPSSQVQPLADVAACLRALRSTDATATVMDVTDFLLERRKDSALEDGLRLGSSLSSAWGVRKTDPELRRELDRYLESLKRSPNWSRLLVVYFGDDALRILGR